MSLLKREQIIEIIKIRRPCSKVKISIIIISYGKFHVKFDRLHGGLSYGRVPGISLPVGRPELFKTFPVYITKHVVLERPVPVPEPVYIEKPYHVPVPVEKIIHKPVPVPIPVPEVREHP